MYTVRQRIYLLWLVILYHIQWLNRHDGDQAAYTSKKNKLLGLTQKNGRRFDKALNPTGAMASDIMAMIVGEIAESVKGRQV